MTEYELAEATALYMDLSLTSVTVFFSFVSGYLLVAYFLGKALSAVQLWIVNLLFFVSSGSVALATGAFMFRAMGYLYEREGSAVVAEEVGSAIGTIGSITLLMIICASYYFMWSTRRSELS